MTNAFTSKNVEVKVTTEKLVAPESVTCSISDACDFVKSALLRNQDVKVTNHGGQDITTQIRMLCDVIEIVGHDVPEFETCLHMDSLRDERDTFYRMADKANYLHTLLYTHDFIPKTPLSKLEAECCDVVDYFKNIYWKIMQETVGYGSLEELIDDIEADLSDDMYNEYLEWEQKKRAEYYNQHKAEIEKECPKHFDCCDCRWNETCNDLH